MISSGRSGDNLLSSKSSLFNRMKGPRGLLSSVRPFENAPSRERFVRSLLSIRILGRIPLEGERSIAFWILKAAPWLRSFFFFFPPQLKDLPSSEGLLYPKKSNHCYLSQRVSGA